MKHKTVTVYSSQMCPYCDRAKQLLNNKAITFNEIRIDQIPGAKKEMIERSKRKTVPQIFIGDAHVGGFDDLYAQAKNGTLDQLLEGDNHNDK